MEKSLAVPKDKTGVLSCPGAEKVLAKAKGLLGGDGREVNEDVRGLAVVGDPHVGTTSSGSVDGYEMSLPRLVPKPNEVEAPYRAPKVSPLLGLVKSAVFGRFSAGKLTVKTL